MNDKQFEELLAKLEQMDETSRMEFCLTIVSLMVVAIIIILG